MPEPTTRPINLTLLQPGNYAHSAAMAELAETLIVALDALRLPFQFNMNKIEPDCTNIVLGAHLLDAETMRAIPADTILYNSEQISENPDENSTWITPAYLDLLKKCVVWDYSEENIRRMKNVGVEGAKFVPIGYVPQLTRIPVDVAQDIDVLFYGAINERRRVILEGLIKKGLRIEFLVGVYREERDYMIARAKVVLNMHYYDAQVFEIVLVSYLLANEKPVVAECGAATAIEPDLRQAVRAVPYDALVDACAELVADNDARAKLARSGLEIFSKRSAPEILARALSVPAPQVVQEEIPGTLNLGSGKDWREDCFNVDINENFRPDAILDIAHAPVEGIVLPTLRFGDVTLRANMFDAIVANDVLEHIPNLKLAMTNCLTLLKPGGTFRIFVPYDLSCGAWQDPTHVRAFNENSWGYYTSWHWYMGWFEARFDLVNSVVHLSEFGRRLKAKGKPFEEIIRTPRAVSHISATLRKRYLYESEIANATQMLQRPFDADTNRNGQSE